MSFWDFIQSKTLGLAFSVIPLLSKAFDEKHADEWIYNQLPAKVKAKGTLSEFKDVIVSGKDFLQACWSFSHS